MKNNNNGQKKFRSPFFAIIFTLILFLIGIINLFGPLSLIFCSLFAILAIFFSYKSVQMQRKSDKVIGIFCLAIVSFFIIFGVLFFRTPQPDRNRARSARIQADLSQFRALAELIYNIDGGYNNVCNESEGGYLAEKTALMDDIKVMSGMITCNNNTSSYCISSTLPSSPGNWCVDSTGNSKSSSCGLATECQ